MLGVDGSLDQVVAPKDNFREAERTLREAGNPDAIITKSTAESLFPSLRRRAALGVGQIKRPSLRKHLQIRRMASLTCGP